MSPSTRTSGVSGRGRPGGGEEARPRGRGQDGFTLLEVLIAFSILAVMLIPILQVFGGSLGGTDRARAFAEGAMLARSKLSEVAAAESLEEGETSGTFEDRPFRWRATVERDTSDVTLPDDTVAGVPAARSGRSRHNAGSSGFGSGASGFGSSNFGSGKSGSSGFGTSGFGSGRSGSSFGTSGVSSFGRSSTGRTDTGSTDTGTDTAGEDASSGDTTAELVPLRITVTVAWGEGRGGGEVSLATDRVARESSPTGGGGQ